MALRDYSDQRAGNLIYPAEMDPRAGAVENLLEQAVKEELNYRQCSIRALSQEWNGRRHQAWIHGSIKPGYPG